MKKVFYNTNGLRVMGVVLFVCLMAFKVKAQLYQQQFTNDLATISSGTVADGEYVNTASPDATKMNYWAVAGTVPANGTIGISSGKLTVARLAGGGAGLVRSTSFTGNPTSLMLRYDYNLTVASGGSSTGLTISIGQNFTNTTSAVSDANTHSRLHMTPVSATPTWKVNNTGTTYNSTQTVLWVINNSGTTMTYKAPDGSFESVANDSYDIWVGSTREVNDNVSTTAPGVITNTASLSTMSIRLGNGTSTHEFDNMLIDPIPSVPTSSAATTMTSTGFTANWTAVSGVTGYRLDVATDAAFTSLVSGYNNLAVPGQATNSLAITGLTSGTTYYYRVRAESGYTVGTFTGGNSATQSTAVLSTELVSFTAKPNSNINTLTWTTASEKNNMQFNIERSTNGQNFSNIGTVKGNGTTTSAKDYTFTDETPLSINYYRLVSVDFDGKKEVSNIVTVSRSTSGKLKVYPTAASDKLTILTDNSETQTYSIFNLLGKMIQTGQLSTQTDVQISSFPIGSYVLKVGNEVVKFVKN